MHLRTDTSAQSHFSRVPTISHSRNAFSIAKKHLTTIQFDNLFPIYTKMIYPGDTLSITLAALSRLTTQVAVLYDDLYIDAHAWFVPHRLVQTNWARYQFNAQPTGPTQDNSALTSPSIDLAALPGADVFESKSLYDYLGYPTLVDMTASAASGEHMNNYRARAYNLIWNENYRDQNLQNAAVVDFDEGPDDPNDYVLLPRGRRFDKFSSALTAQQKGPAATFGLGGTATISAVNPIQTNLVALQADYGAFTGPFTLRGWIDDNVNDTDVLINNVAGTAGSRFAKVSTPVGSNVDFTGYVGGFSSDLLAANLLADLSSATSITVNALRTSVAVQHLLEADARGGTRDVEAIQHRWGVTVPDFRLMRPEYLGGSTFSFDGHIVPQTSETGGTPQGNLTQFSQALSRFSINHSFVEHGTFMILLSARSNITYQQGLPRDYSYMTRFDWYNPEFANIGEVAMLAKEIMFQGGGDEPDNATTWGFNEYAYELRYDDNMVTGEMRSNYPQSRDYTHLAEDYATLPTLSAGWIAFNTAISRNIYVDAATADPIELSTLTTGRIARTLPMYSVPGLLRL